MYFYLNHKRLTMASKVFLLISSLFFYSWWNVFYLPIILISILFNYFIGSKLNDIRRTILSRKLFLVFGISSNIGLLGYFKYTDFLIENLNLIISKNIEALNLALPLAISFFTFQQIAYLVDSYRQETKEYSLLNYAVFVTFFPQLIAGPIVHHSEMMPQFNNKKNMVRNYKNIAMGLFIFSIGLFKKVVIADTFAVWAASGFDTEVTLNLFDAWSTSLSYTFQLYFDFSGYTDMAIGLALIFNIKLPINFNSPYKATNIQEFWRRWHITLSRFLKDYVYIPLGGSRKGEYRVYSNLIATFIIGGIWHGAGWTFIFWGVIHGVALVTHRIWSKLNFKIWTWLAWLITFNFINIAWVFFRAEEWEDAIRIIEGMTNFSNVIVSNTFVSIYDSTVSSVLGIFTPALGGVNDKHFLFYFDTYFYIAASLLIVLRFSNSNQLTDKINIKYLNVVCSVFLFSFSLLFISYKKSEVFIYFNF